jgi:hypothetical protein
MKITINISPKGFEVANFLISQKIHDLKADETLKNELKVTDYDLKQAEAFRQAMLKSFFKTVKGK